MPIASLPGYGDDTPDWLRQLMQGRGGGGVGGLSGDVGYGPPGVERADSAAYGPGGSLEPPTIDATANQMGPYAGPRTTGALPRGGGLSPYTYQGEPPTIEGSLASPEFLPQGMSFGDLLAGMARRLPGGVAGMAARETLRPTPAETGELPPGLYPRGFGGPGMAGGGGPGRTPGGPSSFTRIEITPRFRGVAGTIPVTNQVGAPVDNSGRPLFVPPARPTSAPYPQPFEAGFPTATPGPLAGAPGALSASGARVTYPPVKPSAAKPKAASAAAPDLGYYRPTTGIGQGGGTWTRYTDPNDPRLYRGPLSMY